MPLHIILSFCVEGCAYKYRRTPKIGEPWTPLSWYGRLGWPQDTCKIHAPPHVLPSYHVTFGSSATKWVHINRREHQKLGAQGTTPTWMGHGSCTTSVCKFYSLYTCCWFRCDIGKRQTNVRCTWSFNAPYPTSRGIKIVKVFYHDWLSNSAESLYTIFTLHAN